MGKQVFVVNKIHASCFLCRFFHFIYWKVFKTICNILLDCARENSGFLADQTNLASNVLNIQLACVLIAKNYIAFLDAIEMLNKFSDCRFPWSALSHKSNIFTRFNRKRKIFENRGLGLRILKLNIFKFNIAINCHLSTNIFND